MFAVFVLVSPREVAVRFFISQKPLKSAVCAHCSHLNPAEGAVDCVSDQHSSAKLALSS